MLGRKEKRCCYRQSCGCTPATPLPFMVIPRTLQRNGTAIFLAEDENKITKPHVHSTQTWDGGKKYEKIAQKDTTKIHRNGRILRIVVKHEK